MRSRTAHQGLMPRIERLLDCAAPQPNCVYVAGIGFWVARGLLAHGARVIVTGRRPDKGQRQASAHWLTPDPAV